MRLNATFTFVKGIDPRSVGSNSNYPIAKVSTGIIQAPKPTFKLVRSPVLISTSNISPDIRGAQEVSFILYNLFQCRLHLILFSPPSFRSSRSYNIIWHEFRASLQSSLRAKVPQLFLLPSTFFRPGDRRQRPDRTFGLRPKRVLIKTCCDR
ncbi:hypothetical protein BDN72DRAFT_325995 [Pluteus cervinus]|uniref:Uncharacterized protein n=1 Tax=Pluteus cervinus TaxID=181527 RepID=A0ACD3B2E5_9AGAR|nr:hypothetical protein BDN72DRAFT_325995 [Pluteus cervinus]